MAQVGLKFPMQLHALGEMGDVLWFRGQKTPKVEITLEMSLTSFI